MEIEFIEPKKVPEKKIKTEKKGEVFSLITEFVKTDKNNLDEVKYLSLEDVLNNKKRINKSNIIYTDRNLELELAEESAEFKQFEPYELVQALESEYKLKQEKLKQFKAK